MRVDMQENLKERRDAIDQRWYQFLNVCGFKPILLPNEESSLDLVRKLDLHGILLTGGNSLSKLGGDAPERDAFEASLVKYAIDTKKPLMGVCRGMQVIQNFFGVNLDPIEGHANSYHKIIYLNKTIKVNSYHHFGSLYSVPELIITAKSDDQVVEAVSHKHWPIQGIMWHPEREFLPNPFDIFIFQKHFTS